MPTKTPTPAEQRTLAIRSAMRKLIEGEIGLDRETLAARLQCKTGKLIHIVNGEEPLRWGIAWTLWRDLQVSPAWIAGDSQDRYLPMQGFGFLDWALNADQPFADFYDAHLADAFKHAGKPGVCRFALFQTMDRAKAALVSGKMTPAQELALRTALEPWK